MPICADMAHTAPQAQQWTMLHIKSIITTRMQHHDYVFSFFMTLGLEGQGAHFEWVCSSRRTRCPICGSVVLMGLGNVR